MSELLVTAWLVGWIVVAAVIVAIERIERPNMPAGSYASLLAFTFVLWPFFATGWLLKTTLDWLLEDT